MLNIEDLPDSLILNIYGYLGPYDIANVGKVSRKMRRVAFDELLWRDTFHRYFKVQPFFAQPLGHNSWRDEFIRMIDESPSVEVDIIKKHTDQVLHVSFSRDGELFATCGKDAYVHVWTSSHPVKLKYSRCMKKYQWKYTQYSQFNETDTLLLVSGVLFGVQSTSGEIIVFNLKDDFQMQCRVVNKPYDIFGCWFTENFLLSGDLKWLGSLVSKSIIWLNKASQELESEHAAVMNQIYRFYNPKASSVRSIMIANCVDPTDEEEEGMSNGSSYEESDLEKSNCSNSARFGKMTSVGNPLSNLLASDVIHHHHHHQHSNNNANRRLPSSPAFVSKRPDNVADINYSPEFHTHSKKEKEKMLVDEAYDALHFEDWEGQGLDKGQEGQGHCSQEDQGKKEGQGHCSHENGAEKEVQNNGQDCSSNSNATVTVTGKPGETGQSLTVTRDITEDVITDSRDKWLIFTCGKDTYTPHQIGFKRISPITFKGRIDPGPSLQDRIVEFKRRKLLEQLQQQGQNLEEEIDFSDYAKVADRFDKIDAIIDLKGHVIGMALSPDHRYLYVNSRPWPLNYKITDPLEPPPIASEIDIHVIDLMSLKEIGLMRRNHCAYTSNEECFFIFLDASDLWLASGAEDKFGYVWDRLYGIPLTKLPHTDVCPYFLICTNEDLISKRKYQVVNCVAISPTNSNLIVSVSDDHSIKVWRSKAECRELNLNLKDLNAGKKLYLSRPNSKASTILINKRNSL